MRTIKLTIAFVPWVLMASACNLTAPAKIETDLIVGADLEVDEPGDGEPSSVGGITWLDADQNGI
jgi:hypothetical protein